VPIERLIYEKQTVQEKQPPDTLLAALSEDFALDIWCRRLGFFVLVWGLFSGKSAQEAVPCRQGKNSVGFAFDWPDAFSVWYPAVIRGTLLLGVSKILTLLENKEP